MKSSVLLFLLALFCCHAALAAGRFEAELVRVTDGDTIVVQNHARKVFRVRLAFIDAPERDQPWGPEATRALRRLTKGRWLTIDWHTRDRYDRLVGTVHVSDPRSDCAGLAACPRTIDAGQTLVASGLAWWYRSQAREQDKAGRTRYANLERRARERRKGLWQDHDPIPPWRWRRARR